MLNKGTFEKKGNAKKGLTGRFFHVTILPIGDGKKTLFVKRRTRHASHHYHKTPVTLPIAATLLITITGRRAKKGRKKTRQVAGKKGRDFPPLWFKVIRLFSCLDHAPGTRLYNPGLRAGIPRNCCM